MREAMAGLTVRGRAFLAAGATALVCGMVLGQHTLKEVGVLLLALPLVTAFLVGRGRYRLALIRHIEPQLAEAGRPAHVDLTLTNEGWIPTGTLMLEETVPYTLGARPRFVVARMGHGWRRRVGYRLRSEVRGRFAVGPMTVTVADPFGLVELTRAFQTTTAFTVTPRTVPLPAIPIVGQATSSGDNRPRAFLGGSAEDVTVREYRRGDELRRVHWRSSARLGELMVRREEQPWQARATVFLDNRQIAHRGQGVSSSFEQAVVAAASVAVHLVGLGYAVRLVTSDGVVTGALGVASAQDRVDAGALLEALALVQLVKHPGVDASWVGEAGQGGLTVAVLGAVDDNDVGVLRRVHHHAGAALAITLRVEEWRDRGTAPTTEDESEGGGAPLVAQQGWKAVELGVRDPLAPRWQELGLRTGAPRTPRTPAVGKEA